MGKKNNQKKPNATQQPQIKKEATHTKNPEGYESQYIAWHFESMDHAGSWPCDIPTLQGIEKRLHEFEKKRWSELSGSSHPLPIDKIIPKARRRLSDLGLDDYATIYQFDIRNGMQKQRLWGLRVENIFRILWWDPKHEVYPVEKRGT